MSPSSARAEEDPWAGSYVKPALELEAYLAQLSRSREEAFASMARSIDEGDFRALSNNLGEGPLTGVLC